MLVIRKLSRDPVFWAIACLLLFLVLLANVSGPSRHGGPAPEKSVGGQPAPLVQSGDPVLRSVVNGHFTRLEPGLTLGQAFARYPWFKGEAKWITSGTGGSATVLVNVPLELPGQAVGLGIGSGQASVFYAAEFGFSGDRKSMFPVYSAIEVRDGSGRLTSRIRDKDFLLFKRIMTNKDPGATLSGGIAPGR